jgi:hypothetical protein
MSDFCLGERRGNIRHCTTPLVAARPPRRVASNSAPKFKLSLERRAEVRKRLANGEGVQEVAALAGVSRWTIRRLAAEA